MWILRLKGFIIFGDTLDQFHSRRIQKNSFEDIYIKGATCIYIHTQVDCKGSASL